MEALAKERMAKFDEGSTGMAPNKNWQDKLTTWRPKMVCGHFKAETNRRNTTPAEWWKGRHKKKGHVIMNMYEMDPHVEKKLFYTGVDRPHGKGKYRHESIKSTPNKRPLVVATPTIINTNSKWDGVHPKRISCW